MKDILGVNTLIGSEDTARLNMRLQNHLVFIWNEVEDKFNEFGEAWIFDNPFFVCHLLFLKDIMLCPSSLKFLEAFKPRSNRKSFYAFLENPETHKALMKFVTCDCGCKDSEQE